MNENAKAAVLVSFAADSLALGVHWIYNTRVIDKKLGRVETLLKPEIASFHKGKEKGDFTHYGDQTMLLLECIAAKKGFDADDFARRWRALLESYDGYVDQASKATLANFAAGKNREEAGSESTDLGGAARIAPLLWAYGNDREKLIAAARAQTAMTHNHPEVIGSADFFARAAASVLEGRTPEQAIVSVADDNATDDTLKGWVEDAMESRDRDTRQAISDFGQMCEAPAAFPATLHLILKYENDVKEALVENVMAGGDSSARGMLTGMVLGAYNGTGAVPQEWLSGMGRYQRIVDLLES